MLPVLKPECSEALSKTQTNLPTFQSVPVYPRFRTHTSNEALQPFNLVRFRFNGHTVQCTVYFNIVFFSDYALFDIMCMQRFVIKTTHPLNAPVRTATFRLPLREGRTFPTSVRLLTVLRALEVKLYGHSERMSSGTSVQHMDGGMRHGV